MDFAMSAVARTILAAAPAAISELIRRGVPFDRDSHGRLVLGLEAAHSRRRIVHAGGDSSGREIMRALTPSRAPNPSITVIEGVAAERLLVEDNAVTGVLAESDRRTGGFRGRSRRHRNGRDRRTVPIWHQSGRIMGAGPRARGQGRRRDGRSRIYPVSSDRARQPVVSAEADQRDRAGRGRYPDR